MKNLDILLIFPPISVNERYNIKVGDVGGHLPPLGLAYIASSLEKKGYTVEILDAPALEMNVDNVINKIIEKNPAIIGVTSLTPTFHRVVILADKIKEKFQQKPIIIGGQHATIMQEKILEDNKSFDIVVYGEGEITIIELMTLLIGNNLSKDKLSKIDGIIFRNGERIIKTKLRKPIENLDEIPFPARHLLPMNRYIPLPNQYKRTPVVNMVMIRGCPYQCSFCSNNKVFGRKIRYPSPERAVEEIKHVIKKYGAKEISFWDDMITVNKNWLNNFCDLIIKNKLDIVWSCYARIDSVDQDVLRKMKQAGCWNIFYGIEAGDKKLLDNIDKGITIEQSINAVKWTKEAGIEVRGSFMLCLPGETPELGRKTIAFAIALDPDYAQFSLTTPYPGTKLYEEAKKYGKLDENFDKYDIWEPVFLPFGYKSEKEAKKIQKEAFRRFYIRPKYVLGRIRKIKSFEDIKRYINGLLFVIGFLEKR
jgi:radical SAM superfamily enzyme YgiQ (UPF0313 family)